jgi:hypothetical protein
MSLSFKTENISVKNIHQHILARLNKSCSAFSYEDSTAHIHAEVLRRWFWSVIITSMTQFLTSQTCF